MTRRILYCCPFVPAEWIAAHDLHPSRIVPRAATAGRLIDVRPGACAYAQAFIDHVARDTDASAIVLTTRCDQMRRAPEMIARRTSLPCFLMNVPSAWQTAGARTLYVQELRRLGRFLVQLGGSATSDDRLADLMLEYDAKRAELRAARDRLSPSDYSRALAAFHYSGAMPSPDPTSPSLTNHRTDLALLGGPMLGEDFAIFDVVSRAGGRIVLDGTETGERTMPAPFDPRRTRDDPMAELARAYFDAIPCVFRRPNDRLYEWIKRQVRDRGARGIIYRRHVWCDLWHAERDRLIESVGIPVLDLEGTCDDADGARTRTTGRLQAFLEVLT
ncbi:MAG: 2-hydroxyacyl-CoA dehydratase [Phycisphaerae bacterium]|nr:2-hydroxyacyl-CoA dehydratase [Phycisphaerae bacterium]